MTSFLDPELTIVGGTAVAGKFGRSFEISLCREGFGLGEELPSVRAMAVELAVIPDVVEKAYAELEREGLVTSGEGSGVFVGARRWDGQDSAEYAIAFEELCSEFLAHAAGYGFSSEDVVAYIRQLSNQTLS